MEGNIPYIVLFFLFLFLFLFEKNKILKRREVRIYSAILYIIFFGFRGLVGSDWYNYLIVYDYVGTMSYTSNSELGFVFFIKIFKILGLSYFNFVLFITIIQVFLFDNLINKYAAYVSLSYLILFAVFPLMVVDLLRNFTSILLVFAGVPYLLSRKYIYFILFILLGMLFHTTAIVFIVLFFLKDKIPGRKIITIIFACCILIYVSQINIYNTILINIGNIVGGRIGYLIEQATNSEENTYGLSVGILEKIFIFIFIIKDYDRLKKSNALMVNLLLCFLIINLCFSVSQSFINRFAILFMVGYIVVLNDFFFFSSFVKKHKNVRILFVLFLFLRVYFAFNVDIYEYKNILFQSEDEQQRVFIRNNHYMKK